jgi:hypothetical protein
MAKPGNCFAPRAASTRPEDMIDDQSSVLKSLLGKSVLLEAKESTGFGNVSQNRKMFESCGPLMMCTLITMHWQQFFTRENR